MSSIQLCGERSAAFAFAVSRLAPLMVLREYMLFAAGAGFIASGAGFIASGGVGAAWTCGAASAASGRGWAAAVVPWLICIEGFPVRTACWGAGGVAPNTLTGAPCVGALAASARADSSFFSAGGAFGAGFAAA